ncbi:hypothetical protein CASFOL_000674 [Castilleja foliolosa]|uniref:Ferritin n=1 Tax=Castilleja foliolosa TaxID=1961234 RepID=A0ABD3EKP9_9LAMI
MFLQAISAVSLPSVQNASNLNALSTSLSPNLNSFSGFSSSSSFSGFVYAKKRDTYSGFTASASNETIQIAPLTGVVFQPFEEVQKNEFMVPTDPQASLSRQRFARECEAAINDQINVEYTNSYVYHALYAYFDRDNVALKGLAKFFKEASLEEREHAEKLMEYQNKRGGRVQLVAMQIPPSEFDHVQKGDALYAMELTLALEKLTNDKLLNLHSVADKNNDPQLADFIESEFLEEQVQAIKQISEYVAQLRRVGKGHGVWHFDQMLLQGGAAA